MAEAPVCECGLEKVRKGRRGVWWCYPCASLRVKEWRWGVRQMALDHYGRQCSCCGETTEVFLQFDHIDGGGNKHRREEKIGGGNGLAVWLKRKGWPEGFQVLCANCNLGRHLNDGVCPHNREESK